MCLWNDVFDNRNSDSSYAIREFENVFLRNMKFDFNHCAWNSQTLQICNVMGPLPDTQNCGFRMRRRRECRERVPRQRGLAIPTCITARASHTCREACRDRQLMVSIEVAGGENVPGDSRRMRNLNFTYLARGPCESMDYNRDIFRKTERYVICIGQLSLLQICWT